MNSDLLLQHFDRVSDSPDAVPHLRRFILDLAVRGKLVEQDPADEPASQLLERIAAEKARLPKAGAIKTVKDGGVVTASAPVLRLGWQTTKLRDILLELQTGPFGSSLHKSDYTTAGIPVVNPASIKDQHIIPVEGMAVGTATLERLSSFRLRIGDIVMGRRGEMGRCALVSEREEGWLCGTGCLVLRPARWVFAQYLVMFLGSPFSRAYLNGSAVGATMQNLNQGILLNMPFPLPPLAEQRRIVDKVDELMALCDRLEAARNEREARRDRLITASLHRLDQPQSSGDAEADASTLMGHINFHLDHLSRFSTRSEHIKPLRQTILNLAVRGKLVRQDPADEAAQDFDPAIPEGVARPFAVPSSWRWSRLAQLGTVRGGGTPSKTQQEFWDGTIPWVSPKDMKVDYVHDAQLRITDEAIAGSAANLIAPGAIIFVVRGMILAHSFPVAVTQVPVAVNQDMKALTLTRPEMAEYVLRALKGLKPEMLAKVRTSSHGTCRLESRDYLNFLVPVPPLAEQHRIVARVDQLMALCDQLEVSLAAEEDRKRRLLVSVLHHALAPPLEEAAA